MADSETASKRRMRAPERRAQLLDVARRAFSSSGYHGVSMETVAREAGVTKPILYDHFDSKQDLYVALIEEDAGALEERVRVAITDPTGNRQRIRNSFQAYFDFVDEHAEGFRLFMQESVNPADLTSSVDRVREHIRSEVARLIVRDSGGRLEPSDAMTVAVGLVAMVEAEAQRNPGGPPAERKRQLNTLVRLAWRGISAL